MTLEQQIDEIKKFLICLHTEVSYKDEYITDNYFTIVDLVAKWEKEIDVDADTD